MINKVSMDFIKQLRSPCCYAALDVKAHEIRREALYNGMLRCTSCGKEFPVVKSVIYLFLINANWDIILQELISRRNISQKIFESPPPAELNQRRQEQDIMAGDIMERLFHEAMRVINPDERMSILDIGAGECKTTVTFGNRGAATVAADSDPSGLHFVNFSVFELPPPNKKTVHGRVYYEYMPEPLPLFFNRVIAPAEHLPFASNTFDVVFCRSTLHHLSRLNYAIKEMVRVTRQGGRIVFCSEPLRSCIDPEEPYLEGVVDREEGLNERCPHLLDYVLPLLGEKVKISVQYWRREPGSYTSKLLKWLPFNWDKRFRDGEIASKRKLLKLLLTAASINMYLSKKKSSPDSLPRYWDTSQIVDSLDAIIDVYGRRDWEQIWNLWTQDTNNLMEIRRAILSKKDFGVCELIPHKIKSHRLWQGWGRRTVVDGKACRRIHDLALATLKKQPDSTHVIIEYYLSPEHDNSEFLIKLNGIEAGTFQLKLNQWDCLSVPLPELNETVIDVSLRQRGEGKIFISRIGISPHTQK